MAPLAPSGYLHRTYAESLAEFGSVRELRASGAHILTRAIAGSDAHDAMGCYPLFSCLDWTALEGDLASLEGDLTSLTVVTDPFGAYDEALLERCFPDRMRAFKQHYVVDLSLPLWTDVRPEHRRYARRAEKDVEIESCDDPALFLDTWLALYGVLIERHEIRGISAFSRRAFERQLATPGIVALRAVTQKDTVGMLLFYVQGEVAYYHLGAYTERGYDLRASYALFAFAIQHFFDRGLRFLSLGAGAGTTTDASDGLSRFKRGWANATRLTYLCGRVLDRERYQDLVLRTGQTGIDYFPAYRYGEFR